jgi:hypothetical protein
MIKKTKSGNSKVKFWEKILIRQRQSGLSARKFCMAEKINIHTFAHWRARLGSEQSSFVAIAKLATESRLSPIQIHLPNGVRIELNHAWDFVTQDFVKSLCGVNGGQNAQS